MHLNHVYESCSCFIYPSEFKIISKNNLIVTIISTTGYLSLNQFDSYRYLSQSYTFCKKCEKYITKGKSTKYGIFNRISHFYCQNYPLALENLSIAEKIVIARVYPVVTSLKLKPNNKFNLEAYRGIGGYAVLLS